jgi:hypothetical protein
VTAIEKLKPMIRASRGQSGGKHGIEIVALVLLERTQIPTKHIAEKRGGPLSNDCDRKDGEWIVDECASRAPGASLSPKAQDYANCIDDYSRDLRLAK